MSDPYIKLNTLLSARGYDKGMYFTHEECTALFSLINSFPRWIPVSARLPEEGQQVLSTDGEEFYLDYYAKWDGKQLSFCGSLSWTVTHWMPLPEPPEVRNDKAPSHSAARDVRPDEEEWNAS